MSTIFHRIRAFLYKNLLTENPDDYIARVASDRSLNIREICETAVTRGGADASAAIIEHHVRLFLKEMTYHLCDAYSINTEWFHLSVHVKGVFDSPDEKFNPEKHSIVVDFRAGAELRKAMQDVVVEIAGVADGAGQIISVVDVKSGSTNDKLTPNRNLRINGDKLKVVGDKPGVGVWFVNKETEARTMVDPSDMVANKPSELIVLIPALAEGDYGLEIVSQFTTGALLKEPRTISFDKTLKVK
jgi:hypothetical protein